VLLYRLPAVLLRSDFFLLLTFALDLQALLAWYSGWPEDLPPLISAFPSRTVCQIRPTSYEDQRFSQPRLEQGTATGYGCTVRGSNTGREKGLFQNRPAWLWGLH